MLNEFNTIITGLTLLAHILIAIFLLLKSISSFNPFKKYYETLKKTIRKQGMKLALITSFVATLGSLFYSEIAGFDPCVLCWYQRIFMYVLPIIALTAIYYKDKKAKRYILPISIIGGLTAFYHIIVQLTPRVTCTLQGVDCSIISTIGFGYITIPVMSLTAFIMITYFSYQYK